MVDVRARGQEGLVWGLGEAEARLRRQTPPAARPGTCVRVPGSVYFDSFVLHLIYFGLIEG